MKFLRAVLGKIIKLMGLLLNPLLEFIFHHIYDRNSSSVSPITNKLLLKSGFSLAKMIRDRKLKSSDLMEVFISRVKEVNPIINAAVAYRFEKAREEAKAVDAWLDKDEIDKSELEKSHPYLGVPLSVKEAFSLKGMPNTAGLVLRKGHIADEDAPVVSHMLKAGAIPFVMTNLSELCMWYESSNFVYGITKNAYNTSRIVGGSSGGEGCLLSSGASVIGIGSDIGGSIRMPSFFNGVYGHKPSRGAVPNEGQFPIASGKEQLDLMATGPMCRYAEDLLPLLKILSQSTTQLKLDEKVDLKKLKFYSMEDDGGSLMLSEVDPQLKQMQRKVVKHFQENLDLTVRPVSLSKMKYSLEMWSAKMGKGDKTFCQMMANEEGSVNVFLELLKKVVGKSDYTLPAIGLGLVEKLNFMMEGSNKVFLSMLEKLREEMNILLEENGILLYPSHPKIAPYHNEPMLRPFNFAYTGIFNTLGLPVTQCPLGLSTEGLPLGIQVVGAMNRDHQTIAVARELEKVFGGWVPPNGPTVEK